MCYIQVRLYITAYLNALHDRFKLVARFFPTLLNSKVVSLSGLLDISRKGKNHSQRPGENCHDVIILVPAPVDANSRHFCGQSCKTCSFVKKLNPGEYRYAVDLNKHLMSIVSHSQTHLSDWAGDAAFSCNFSPWIGAYYVCTNQSSLKKLSLKPFEKAFARDQGFKVLTGKSGAIINSPVRD